MEIALVYSFILIDLRRLEAEILGEKSLILRFFLQFVKIIPHKNVDYEVRKGKSKNVSTI